MTPFEWYALVTIILTYVITLQFPVRDRSAAENAFESALFSIALGWALWWVVVYLAWRCGMFRSWRNFFSAR